MRRKIILQSISLPRANKRKEKVKWLCDSLGLIRGRDLEDTSFKILNELLDSFSSSELISTDEIARSLKMESPRINHHVRGLSESGLIFREKRKIALRGGSLSAAIEEMRRDSERMFDQMLEISKKLDKDFHLN